jgi:nucleoside-diphosphate-sugar epimerase
MRILVTGGAGYKGTALVDALLSDGHEVTIYDNFLYGYGPALPLARHERCSIVQGDIRSLTRETVAGRGAVFHLAGISGPPACAANPHSARTVNVDGTRRLVDLLDAETLLVFAGSTAIYGSSDAILDEKTPPRPPTLYAETKWEAEQICMARPNTVTLRCATLFGTSHRMRCELMVNDFVHAALTRRSLVLFDAGSVRGHVHVRDAVRAYRMALRRENGMAGNVFNVGGPRLNLTKRELAEKIKQVVDVSIVESDLPDVDTRDLRVGYDKIAALGFEPEIGIEQGILELVALFRWYRPQRPFATI